MIGIEMMGSMKWMYPICAYFQHIRCDKHYDKENENIHLVPLLCPIHVSLPRPFVGPSVAPGAQEDMFTLSHNQPSACSEHERAVTIYWNVSTILSVQRNTGACWRVSNNALFWNFQGGSDNDGNWDFDWVYLVKNCVVVMLLACPTTSWRVVPWCLSLKKRQFPLVWMSCVKSEG